ncbi:hypothetical protein TRFO_35462 [Tritrichomonas foetus]|uniref:Uncharacterized protein n=1 Tax=Tritrichomonas foetus TaxID=1144522 RepID=A0A1J4JKN7_9EUKA|nr:hypothetical protein TRFO_35462 [Tritrichomonas foetus]|eukprot:OHS98139.1 hypothetical protein TRFO_35462 [Tritrichomonas foetus]
MNQKDIFARRSLRDRLTVGPADFDTSPRFGDSSPRYTIKEKRKEKVVYDNKDFPNHLGEPNDTKRSPAYSIRPRYSDKIYKGNEYCFYPQNFGSDGLKKTISGKIEGPQRQSYVSPDKYNTRYKMGDSTPKYSIGTKLESSWVNREASPGPKYDSNKYNDINWAKSPRYTINDNKTNRSFMSSKEKSAVPGPGSYETRKDFSSLKYSISEKFNDPKIPKMPGPDEHALQEPWGKKGIRSTIGQKFKEKKNDYVGSDYIDPPNGIGADSASKRRILEDTGVSWIPKSFTPGPGSYAPEKVSLPSQKKSIGKKLPEARNKEPNVGYIGLPELPRGRQCTIGEKETLMEFVF